VIVSLEAEVSRLWEDEQLLEELGITPEGGSANRLIGTSDLADSQKDSVLDKIVEKLFGWLGPKRKYAYVMALLVLGLIIVMPGSYVVYYVLEDDQPEDFLAELTYEEAVPYGYKESSLRSADLLNREDSLVILFNREFKLAIGEYLLTDYNQAVLMFNQMELLSDKILRREVNEQTLSLIRNYFLYRGLSEYALGMSVNLSMNDKNIVRSNSITQLNKGLSLASEHDLPRRDVENYFLGILHYLNNDKQSAIRHLSNISERSEFYRDAQIMLVSLKSD